MKRLEFLLSLAGAMAASGSLRAQQKPMPVIGYLNPASPGPNAPNLAAFREGLSEAGYGEGQNLAIEYRWAEGHPDRLPTLAADFVGRQVDVIAANGDSAALAAKSATSTIPIVFFGGGDPVAMGLVASLARPGGNLTGVAFSTSARSSSAPTRSSPAGAISSWRWRQAIVPAIYTGREFAASGGLISYGASLTSVFRQLGIYAGKILKGAKPADLPVEQPTRFELVVNLKTAATLGLTVPPSILARADEVIE